MCSLTLRKAAATLLLAVVVTLSCAAPSQASLFRPRHGTEEPGPGEPGRSFVSFSFVVGLFELVGGALDPNGIW